MAKNVLQGCGSAPILKEQPWDVVYSFSVLEDVGEAESNSGFGGMETAMFLPHCAAIQWQYSVAVRECARI